MGNDAKQLAVPEKNTGLAPGEIRPPSIQMGERGLQLNTLDELWRFAGIAQSAGLAPKGMESRESIVIAIQLGAEVGLQPLAALQNIAVVNGRPSIWGDAMPAVCMNSPNWDPGAFLEEMEGEGDATVAHCRVRRRGGQPVERSFSVADAKKAGLWGKSGPWSQYPKRMLQMRARSWALRDCFPDALKGMCATEEAQDFIDLEPQQAKAVIQPPKRITPASPSADNHHQSERQGDPSPPEAPEDGPPPEEPQEAPDDAPQEPPPRNMNFISEKQRKRLYAIYKSAGITDDQMKAYLDEEWNVQSSRLITLDMYDEVCAWVESYGKAS